MITECIIKYLAIDGRLREIPLVINIWRILITKDFCKFTEIVCIWKLTTGCARIAKHQLEMHMRSRTCLFL